MGIFLGKPRLSPRARKVCTAAAIFLFFVLLFATVFAHALCRKLDHYEEQFVSAGALLLRAGLHPFRDAPFFHLPHLLVFARMTALLGLLRSVESNRAAQWIFFSGPMLGLAMGSRLTFAPMPVAFLAILIVLPSRN